MDRPNPRLTAHGKDTVIITGWDDIGEWAGSYALPANCNSQRYFIMRLPSNSADVCVYGGGVKGKFSLGDMQRGEELYYDASLGAFVVDSSTAQLTNSE